MCGSGVPCCHLARDADAEAGAAATSAVCVPVVHIETGAAAAVAAAAVAVVAAVALAPEFVAGTTTGEPRSLISDNARRWSPSLINEPVRRCCGSPGT